MRTIILCLIAFCSAAISAQEQDYLAIMLESDITNEINYPPGTEFFLFDDLGNLVASNENLTQPFNIKERHILVVTPSYKEDTDRFVLTSGTIEMKSPKGHKRHGGKAEHTVYKDNDKGVITAKKEYFESEIPGTKNLLLVFDNDLVFRYFDGQARAWYQGDELPVEGNYIVALPSKVAKISYNPDNGEVWWVFETTL